MIKKKIIRQNHGFTLIELLIVIVIIGLLASLVAPRMFGKLEKSKRKIVQAQISLFETALDSYRLDEGQYPTSEQGLQALRTKPNGVGKWDGPYLPKNIPLDSWGHPYVYSSPGEHGAYDIISYGADGKPGGKGNDADIVSW